MTEGAKAPQLSPDGKWWWDGVSWRPIAHASSFALAMRVFDLAVVGMLCWVVVSIAFAVVLAVMDPTYWDPMFSTTTGAGLLAAGVVAIGFGLALTWVARKLVRPSRGRQLAGGGIILVAFLIQFFTLWIVMLGPAIVILASPRPS